MEMSFHFEWPPVRNKPKKGNDIVTGCTSVYKNKTKQKQK